MSADAPAANEGPAKTPPSSRPGISDTKPTPRREKSPSSRIKAGVTTQPFRWDSTHSLYTQCRKVIVTQAAAAVKKAKKIRRRKRADHVILIESEGAPILEPRSRNVFITSDGEAVDDDPEDIVQTILIYLRVSSDEQAKSKALEDQLTDLLPCVPDRVKVGAICFDDYTGTTYDRPGFGAAQELARLCQVDAILVWDMRRYGRDEEHGAPILFSLHRLGAPIVRPKRHGSTRLLWAMMNEEDARERALDDLREAEFNGQSLQDGLQRGIRSAARNGRFLQRSDRFRSIFYELTTTKPDGCPDDGSFTAKGAVPLYMQRRQDAAEAFDTLEPMILACKTEPEFDDVAHSHNMTGQQLEKELMRPWLDGHYYKGSTVFSDATYEYLRLCDPDRLQRIRNHLASLAPAPAAPRRAGAVQSAIVQKGAIRVYTATEGDVTVRCPVTENGIRCILAMTLNSSAEDWQAGQDYWECVQHGRSRVFKADALQRLKADPPACTKCSFLEWMHVVRHVKDEGDIAVVYHCFRCNHEETYDHAGPATRPPLRIKRQLTALEKGASPGTSPPQQSIDQDWGWGSKPNRPETR